MKGNRLHNTQKANNFVFAVLALDVAQRGNVGGCLPNGLQGKLTGCLQEQVGHREATQQGWELVFGNNSREDVFSSKISECLTILR